MIYVQKNSMRKSIKDCPNELNFHVILTYFKWSARIYLFCDPTKWSPTKWSSHAGVRFCDLELRKGVECGVGGIEVWS